MYTDLSTRRPGFSDADIGKYFKDASFGVKPDDVDAHLHRRATT